jgi:uncharacterized membrane protein
VGEDLTAETNAKLTVEPEARLTTVCPILRKRRLTSLTIERDQAQVADVTHAGALHVLFVVLWIGGVAFVTTVFLPAVRDLRAPAERVAFFEMAERRFGNQSRVTTALTGLSGLYMIIRLDLWDRFLSVEYWWMHAMVAVWLLFTLMLFVAEPLFLDRFLLDHAKARPQSTFRLVERLHWICWL